MMKYNECQKVVKNFKINLVSLIASENYMIFKYLCYLFWIIMVLNSANLQDPLGGPYRQGSLKINLSKKSYPEKENDF